MAKIVLKRFFTYLFYLVFSFGLGYLSTLGESDYVGHVSGTIIPILLTLMILYAAISGQLIVRLIEENLKKSDLNSVVDSMERNVVLEAILLILTFAYLACFSWLSELIEEKECLFAFVQILRNAIVCFDFLYFVYVVYDSIVGLYHLLKS